MGFMLMEWGLGLYSLAVLHIVSHAVYKAHAFLSSGSVVDHFRAPMLPTKRPGRIMGPIISSLAIAGLIVIGTEAGFGMLLPQRHSLLVMGAILGLAITQLVSQVWNKGQIGGQRFLWIVVGLSVLAAVAYFALDTLFIVRFSSLWPATVHQPPSIIQNGLLVLVFAVFAILLLVQQFVPRFLNNPLWQAIYVHLYNNLYIDAVFTQWVRRLGRGHMQQTSQAIRPSQSPEVISS
jgi:NADH:ubiquinone oxidoreductase subunit 5 (subunit L)/multisubunit Na+/H+ antiporter MnhA subunit